MSRSQPRQLASDSFREVLQLPCTAPVCTGVRPVTMSRSAPPPWHVTSSPSQRQGAPEPGTGLVTTLGVTLNPAAGPGHEVNRVLHRSTLLKHCCKSIYWMQNENNVTPTKWGRARAVAGGYHSQKMHSIQTFPFHVLREKLELL